MKIKHIVLATTMMVTLSTFAQKDELKALKKIYAKEEIKGADLAEYKALVTKVEPLATEESDKIYAGFYKAMVPMLEVLSIDKTMTPLQIQMMLAKSVTPKTVSDLAAGLNATLDYEKKTGKKVYTDDINETITSFKPDMINMAYALGKDPNNKQTSHLFYAIYQLDKKDAEQLYNAANFAVNAKDFDAALDYYLELKALNYSGEGTAFLAMNKSTKKEEAFNSKVERDLFIKAGSHESPRDEKTPSKRGEIYKNIALILVQKDRIEEAKKAVADARKLDPNDTSLIVTEADLYFKLKDFDSYKRLINEALEKNPNDADLVYNLGIVSAQANNYADVEKYYLRVIAIDPKYINAYLNLADSKLQADKPIVEEMNKLTTSDKDNKRYEVLKKNREVLFKAALPYLEKAHELEATNEVVIDNLLSVYRFLEMTTEYKALKATKQ